MNFNLTNILSVSDEPPWFRQNIRQSLTVPNPAFVAAEKMGRYTGNLEPYLAFYKCDRDGIHVPRGYLTQALATARKYRIPCEITDCTTRLPDVEITFTGSLKPFQRKAVAHLLNERDGVLEAPTGSGKTVMALRIIAARRQPTLIIVHTKELLNQWLARIETFLSIPKDTIGVIGGGKKTVGTKITVAIINSLYPMAASLSHQFGHVVIDECHRCPSRTFGEAVSSLSPHYLLGLSATPYRRDGLTELINWHLGPTTKVDSNSMTDHDIVKTVHVLVRRTNFAPTVDPTLQYSTMLTELCASPSRNWRIARDVVQCAEHRKGTILVLSDRKSHCDLLATLVRQAGTPADVLTGSSSKKDRTAIVNRINTGEARVVLATSQLLGEGFDAAGLGTLFLATPVKFSGRLLQCVGRILRPQEGKQNSLIVDYVDFSGVLLASFRARQRVYREKGFLERQ